MPAFPVAVLPAAVRRLVEEGAAALGVPPDLVAVPLLTFTAAVLGDTRRIQLKPGYELYPTLFTAIVAPPGSAKSPALSLARAPLDTLQDEARRRWDDAREQFRQLQAEAAAGGPSRGGTRRPDPAERTPPRMDHLFTTDSTTEAVAWLLTSSPGLVLIRDELVGWVNSFDAYRAGRGGDRQVWLSLWNNHPLKIDRKSSEPICVMHPVVCVCGGVQPDLLPRLAGEADQHDGFVDRILWSFPDTAPTIWSDDAVAPATIGAVTDILRRLRRRPPEGEGTVRLDRAAHALWVSWFNDNARGQLEGVEGLRQGFAAKLPNHAARLALVLHCLTHPANPASRSLSAATLSGALELAEYFRAHGDRALSQVAPGGAVAGSLPLRVLAELRAAGGEWLPRTRLYAGPANKVSAAALNEALAALEVAGLAERRRVDGAGRPAEEWRAILPREESEESEESPPWRGQGTGDRGQGGNLTHWSLLQWWALPRRTAPHTRPGTMPDRPLSPVPCPLSPVPCPLACAACGRPTRHQRLCLVCQAQEEVGRQTDEG